MATGYRISLAMVLFGLVLGCTQKPSGPGGAGSGGSSSVDGSGGVVDVAELVAVARQAPEDRAWGAAAPAAAAGRAAPRGRRAAPPMRGQRGCKRSRRVRSGRRGNGSGGQPDRIATRDATQNLKDVGLFPAFPDMTQVHPRAVGFKPRHELWSNGLGKARFAILPDGQKINSSTRDAWDFPIGTLFFKTFFQDPGAGGKQRPVETRLIRRKATTGLPNDTMGILRLAVERRRHQRDARRDSKPHSGASHRGWTDGRPRNPETQPMLELPHWKQVADYWLR